MANTAENVDMFSVDVTSNVSSSEPGGVAGGADNSHLNMLVIEKSCESSLSAIWHNQYWEIIGNICVPVNRTMSLLAHSLFAGIPASEPLWSSSECPASLPG